MTTTLQLIQFELLETLAFRSASQGIIMLAKAPNADMLKRAHNNPHLRARLDS